MTAVVGRALGWVCSWGRGSRSKKIEGFETEGHKQSYSSQTTRGWTSWLWGGWRRQNVQSSPDEQYWEAQERVQPLEVEELFAGKQDSVAHTEHVSRWWNKYLPTAYFLWPRQTDSSTLRQRKHEGLSRGAWDDVDGDFRTPPPSPVPPSSPLTSPFRLFADSWNVEILPEHYEVCFNFLRHLFDLFVVGFLWTVSPPTKLILEVLGVQGALRLWIHGMAMFFVSTVGMAGLLWVIQEYLPQFALIYGIIQAVVISVSVRQSVLMDVEEENVETDEGQETDEMIDSLALKENSAMDKVKTS
ncbi:hypothetical protein JOB18_028408 [Solea senegalensis]|uniref:Uncharacterized protein n=1 Tax=Solea senegalensis TaxID=28829 RepID=A0AAV6R5S3_SOLSE|nr:uncharacterized protein C6orf47 homolog [Solea senegalensis]KAG7500752.1 hypothetical protein JOB18_028408 [Solea senegalensis]